MSADRFSPWPPPYRWIGSGTYLGESDFTYRPSTGRQIVARRGLITDFLSIPAWARWAIRTDGKGVPAAIIHDALYKGKAKYGGPVIKRAEADRIFRRALIDCGESKSKSRLMWLAVRAGGRGAWRRGHK